MHRVSDLSALYLSNKELFQNSLDIDFRLLQNPLCDTITIITATTKTRIPADKPSHPPRLYPFPPYPSNQNHISPKVASSTMGTTDPLSVRAGVETVKFFDAV